MGIAIDGNFPTRAGNGFEVIKTNEADPERLANIMKALASDRGVLEAGRFGREIEPLMPVSHEMAFARSPSATAGTGAIQFHQDGAHKPKLPRWLLIGALDSTAKSPTRLKPIPISDFTEAEIDLLISAPIFVRNGRKSFYSSLFNRTSSQIRFDPYCMEPINERGKRAFQIFFERLDKVKEVEVPLNGGDIVIIDNLNTLHGRPDCTDAMSRRLLRGCVK